MNDIQGTAGHSGNRVGEGQDKELGLPSRRTPLEVPSRDFHGREVFRESRCHAAWMRALVLLLLGMPAKWKGVARAFFEGLLRCQAGSAPCPSTHSVLVP